MNYSKEKYESLLNRNGDTIKMLQNAAPSSNTFPLNNTLMTRVYYRSRVSNSTNSITRSL